MSAPLIQFSGPNRSVEIFGIKLLGVNAHNAHKLLFTLIFLLSIWLFAKIVRALANRFGGQKQKTAFWSRQGISIALFVLAVLGFGSIWFDNPARLATGLGLVSAGLAFALQKVVTSFAGYIVILRGKTFNVGDRIVMGGVRGDVIALNFIQTVIMEMGEPPATQSEDPGMWVMSRQYSGRIVIVSNATIFESPVYNYTRDFPYIWEEMHIPISYKDDRRTAEQILLKAAADRTVRIDEMADSDLKLLEQRYFVKPTELSPRVFYRLTDNWVELTVRFLCKDHDIRSLKDRMSRDILDALEEAKIGIASGTYEIVGMPPLSVRVEPTPAAVDSSLKKQS
jgi:small-conductance mechanosensitive channel